MADFGDFIAHGVITQALVCEGDSTLEDLGIMSLEPGQIILKCKGAERLDDDKWMEKATALMRDMFKDKVKEATCLNLETGEWFIHGRDAETIEGWRERMEALGIEVDDGA